MNQPPSTQAISSVYRMIRKLGSRRAAVRAEAEQALLHLTDVQVEALVQISRGEIKKSRLRLVAGIAAYLCVVYFANTYWNAIRPVYQWLFVLSLPVDYLLLLRLIANPRLQNSIVRALTVAQDPRLLGPLITKSAGVSRNTGVSRYSSKWRSAFTSLIGYNSDLYSGIAKEIIRIVAGIQPGDEIEISATEAQMLELVMRSPNPEFVLCLLRLLEMIGDNRYRVIIRALEGGSYSGADSSEVREAAARCWKVISARLAGQKHAGTLLRASQSDTGTAELVRPVAESNQEVKAVLLRAGEREE